MSLYGVLRSGVSGMNAQSSKLGTVAENIQNGSTTGYKSASIEFSSLILPSSGGGYNSGSVTSNVRYSIGDQGPISYTGKGEQLAVSGNGFFIVTDPGGTPYLTRAGAFKVDGSTGNMVNVAGFTLMGYNLSNGPVEPALNSITGLEPVNMLSFGMQASASTEGLLKGNLPWGAAAGDTKNTSLEVYTRVGTPVKLNVTMTKVDADTWNVAVTDGGTPPTALGNLNVDFDPDGQVVGTPSMAFTIPGGEPFTFDLGGLTNLDGEYSLTGEANGNKPSAVEKAEIAEDGTVYAVYADGSRVAAYRIPLATVQSPDNLAPRAGNVYEATQTSGDYQVGFPKSSGFGTIASGALEGSNVDIGSELTAMIEAQTSYTANSKVFQTGSELLDVLMNLKR